VDRAATAPTLDSAGDFASRPVPEQVDCSGCPVGGRDVIVEWAYTTFGPFLIPVVVFAAGLVGYAVLVFLYRRGILGEGREDPVDERFQ
jgi:hypothetical protein